MTVRELIELLQTMPPDHQVLYGCCSGYAILKAEDIKLQNSTDTLNNGMAVPHHNMPGEVRAYGHWEYGPDDVKPAPLNAVIFPGN